MIEGNRLTQEQVDETINKEKYFKGRERDEKEVLGYYAALEHLEILFIQKRKVILEDDIKLMHDLIMAHIDDFVPDDENYTSKRDIENGLSEKLLGNIPKEIREEFMKLFLEYQKEETKESKLARECDKLDTLFQTVIYSEKKERNILKEFLPFYKKKFTSKTGKKLFAELEEYSENFA